MSDVTGAASTNVRVSVDGRVATAVIDRPPVNALSSALLLELRETFRAFADDHRVRCVVLTGAGSKCFVAGADIREAAATPPERAPERSASGHTLMRMIEDLPVPVIMAVNGLCLGGGCELALAGDIRIAAEHARFGQPEVKLGIMPGFGGTQRLPRLIGAGPALDLLLTGRDISAQEALGLGLVSRVVPAADLASVAADVARTIAEAAPASVRAIKRAVRGGLERSLPDALDWEAQLSAEIRRSPDAVEGLQAFVEKRRPRFS